MNSRRKAVNKMARNKYDVDEVLEDRFDINLSLIHISEPTRP